MDERLAGRLRAELPQPELTLFTVDALEADLAPLLAAAGAPSPLPLVGNLPYGSATPMVRAFVRRPELFSRIVVMVQREVALRFAARPGDDAYGFLSVDIAAHAAVRLLFDVPPGSFVPPPKVHSTVVELVPFRPVDPAADTAALSVASAGFATRRKTLANALGAVWGREEARAAIVAEGLAPAVRAEELSLREFRGLSLRLGSPASAPP
jgi:16S rRNA (adenine1518-N6/adenine1519-N6)-dimethyltransferase